VSLLLLSRAKPKVTPRQGLVVCDRRVVSDQTGIFHPLGLTFFWALYGWKFERDRIFAHLDWLRPKGFDYLRILGEVDWEGRSIEPSWPDYQQVLADFIDFAYKDCGLRTQVTIVGGRQYDQDTGARRFVPTELTKQVTDVVKERAHKVLLLEMANEWTRLDKVAMDDLIDMGKIAVEETDNLVALSCPSEKDEDDETSGHEGMKNATAKAGANAFTIHPKRTGTDDGWAHVRQGYDFKNFDTAVYNNEPEGPQSSVESMDNPLQLASCRLLGVVCGGAGYVLHVGQGVTGVADPEHGRPENMWEVPNIDEIMRIVRQVDPLLPVGVENWKVVNNNRHDHPLPLPGDSSFWYEPKHEDRAPAVNKNYASYAGSQFVVMLTGVKSHDANGPVPVGAALHACHVEAYDPVTLARVDQADLAQGEAWSLPGRADTMAAYLVRGTLA
jgi:hypothetical protein